MSHNSDMGGVLSRLKQGSGKEKDRTAKTVIVCAVVSRAYFCV